MRPRISWLKTLHFVVPFASESVGFLGLCSSCDRILTASETFFWSELMNNFPHLQLVDLSFLEKPEFDFVLKPVGFDLNMIPGLSGFIESQVHATLGPMM